MSETTSRPEVTQLRLVVEVEDFEHVQTTKEGNVAVWSEGESVTPDGHDGGVRVEG